MLQIKEMRHNRSSISFILYSKNELLLNLSINIFIYHVQKYVQKIQNWCNIIDSSFV